MRSMLGVVLVAGLLGGCMGTPRYLALQNDEPSEETGGGLFGPVNYRIDAAAFTSPPACIAVLPLAIDEAAAQPLSLEYLDAGGRNAADGEAPASATREPAPYRMRFDAEQKRHLVRQMLYGFVSARAPRDIELRRIDRATGGSPPATAEARRRVARRIGCDWLLEGRITEFNVDFLGVYSNIRIGADLRLIHAGRGTVLWEGRHVAHGRAGSVPLTPVDLALGAVKAVSNLEPDQLERVAADLARRLVRTMPLEPDNPFLLASRGERLYQVQARALNLRQGPGVDYPVRRVLRGRERVSLIGADPVTGWLRIRTREGEVGYVARHYLRPVEDGRDG